MKRTAQISSPIAYSIVGILLLLMVLQLAFSVKRETQTADEACHIYAGYSYWRHGDYGMNPEHPPLVKLLAAAPLLGMQLREPSQVDLQFKKQAFVEGRDFLYSNDADRILFRTRMAASLMSVLLGLLVYLAAREMFGQIAAFVALALIVFEPNILAHGALVTTDVGLSCFLVAAIYAFYRYVKAPTVWRLTTTGVAVGLALASKHSGVLVAPMLVLLAVCELVPLPLPLAKGVTPHEAAVRAFLALLIGCVVSFGAFALAFCLTLGMHAGLMAAGQFTLMITLPILGLKTLLTLPTSESTVMPQGNRAVRFAFVFLTTGIIAMVVLWAAYGFRYKARPSDMQMNPPLSEFQKELNRPLEENVMSALARFHILPEAYLYGLVDVRKLADYHPSYLFGNVYFHGKWYYFPIAFLIKSTAAFLIMITLSVIAIAFWDFTARREILFVAVPAVLYFVIAMSSGLNVGIRHLLPVYPFLAVLAGGGAAALIRYHRRWAYVVAILLAWHAASSLHSFPEYLPYANEFWGGSSHIYKYLSDSNIELGQPLKSVAEYLERKGTRECYFANSIGTLVNLNYYGIPCKPLTARASLWLRSPIDVPPSINGPVLISASVLLGSTFGPGDLNPYIQFQHLTPTAVIDHSVFVFDGHYDIALASALNRANRAQNLMEEGRLDEALRVAQQAVDIAHNSIQAQLTLGDVFKRLNRPTDAQIAHQRALVLAQALGSENQEWIAVIKNAGEQ